MRIKLRLFWHIAEPLPVRDAVALDGLAFKENLAVGRLDESGDHFKGGRLTRAVRAQVAGYFASAGSETDILDSRSTGIHFGNVAQYKIVGHYVAFYFIQACVAMDARRVVA